jgi:hypothetical protein
MDVSRYLTPAVALLLLTASVGSVSASSTRLTSLGGDGDYLEDSHNVLRWFGSLPDFGNLAVLELGDLQEEEADGELPMPSNQGAGGHFYLDSRGRFGTVAFYVSEVASAGQVPGTVTAIWSRTFDPVQVGLFSNWTDREGPAGEADLGLLKAEEDWAVGIGLRAELAARVYGDLAAELRGTGRRLGGFQAPVEELDSWEGHSWRVRLFVGVTEKVALVPVVDYFLEDHLDLLERFGVPADRRAHQTRLGIGLNYFPDPDNMILVSYEYRDSKETFQPLPLESSSLLGFESRVGSHRLRFGLESRVLPWLTLRGGAMQAVPERDEIRTVWSPTGPDRQVEELGTPEMALSLGLGVHFAEFDADLVFSGRSPFSLGHFLTGSAEDGTANFSSITLTYRF